MNTPVRVALAGAVALCVLAEGAPIIPGNLLVYRVDGNGAALGSDAAIVRVDEFDLFGNLIQTFTMPSGPSGVRLTSSGTATSEGKLTTSPNGEYIAFLGYDAEENTPTVRTNVNRTVAVITRATGHVNLDTTGPLAGSTANDNARSAVVDNTGTNIWIASHSGPTASRGVFYLTRGQTTPGVQLANVNSRGVRILGSQLYEWGDAAGNYGVFEVGVGLPTSGPVTLNGLPGVSGSSLSTYGFYMADLDTSVPGYDTLWMARDTTGVSKYSLVGGTWTLNNTIGGLGMVLHIDGLVHPGGVRLAIVAGGGSSVQVLNDTTGYNQPMTGSFSSLATAPSFNAFRGVAFVVPEPGTVGLMALAVGVIAMLRRRQVTID